MLPSIDFLVVAPWPRCFAPLALLSFRLIARSVAKVYTALRGERAFRTRASDSRDSRVAIARSRTCVSNPF
jgi:hypothetical protein